MHWLCPTERTLSSSASALKEDDTEIKWPELENLKTCLKIGEQWRSYMHAACGNNWKPLLLSASMVPWCSMCFLVLWFERIAFTFLQLASVAAWMVTSMHLNCENLRALRYAKLDAADLDCLESWSIMKLWILREAWHASRFFDSRTCWGSHHRTIRWTPDRKPFSDLQKKWNWNLKPS